MRKDLITGIVLIIFGFAVGGIGIVSAGVGIGIPGFVIIFIGSYFVIRSKVTSNQEKKEKDNVIPVDSLFFEKSRVGKILIGLILLLIGFGAIGTLPGILMAVGGIWLLYLGFRKI